ncbi:MAG: iron ABC transporter permease [Beijerinckiaceae bacterium]|nr:iron ABC transporter permease [Beijerinckiaceae bacterium]
MSLASGRAPGLTALPVLAGPSFSRDGFAVLVLLIAAAGLFGLMPLGRLLLTALAPDGLLSFESVASQIASRAAGRATWHTLETAGLSAIGALVLGAGFALTLAITDVRGKRALAFLFVFSLMVAPQVIALAFLSMAGPASPVLAPLGLAPAPGTANPLFGRNGTILVMALHHAPLVAITVWSGLRYLPRSVIEAAQLEGATTAQVVRRILLPMLRGNLVAGGLLAFVAGVGNFGIPALLGMPVNYLTLPTLIYRRLTSFGPSVLSDMAALAMVVAVIAGIGTIIGAVLMRRNLGKVDIEQRMTPFAPLGPWRLPVEIALWTLLAFKVGLPFLSLLGDALRPALGVPLGFATITLEKFHEVLVRQDVTTRAFRNSFLMAATAAMILCGLAILFAYVLERRVKRLRPALEALIEVPYALPGVVLAIACILLFLKPLPLIGISIYGTVFIILFAYLARFLAPAMKPVLAAMGQIEVHHEEAARLDGATYWQLMRFIVAPILLPAASAGALLVFLVAFNELTVSALLWSAGTETLGVVLFSLKETGLAGEAAAVAISASVVILAVMLGLDRMAHRLPDGVLPWRI